MAHERSLPDDSVEDKSAGLTFLRWLYGDDPPGWLTISTFDSQPTQWFPAHKLDQVATFCQAIARRYNVYVGLGLREEQVGEGRGESADVLAIPGFWIELDLKHAVHTRVNLPETIEQAIFLVDEAIPLKPSLIMFFPAMGYTSTGSFENSGSSRMPRTDRPRIIFCTGFRRPSGCRQAPRLGG